MKSLCSTASSIAIIILGVFGGFVWCGGRVACLFILGLLTMIILGTIGTTTLSFGFQATLNAFQSASILWNDNSKRATPLNRDILLFMADRVYPLGFSAVVMGIIITMGNISGSKQEIGHHIASALTGLFNAVFIAEAILRPIATRIDFRLQNPISKTEKCSWIWMALGLMTVLMALFLVLWLVSGD